MNKSKGTEYFAKKKKPVFSTIKISNRNIYRNTSNLRILTNYCNNLAVKILPLYIYGVSKKIK